LEANTIRSTVAGVQCLYTLLRLDRLQFTMELHMIHVNSNPLF